MWEQPWRQADCLRRSFGDWLDAAGFGPREHPWTEAASSSAGRVRHYRTAPAKPARVAVLIVPAPIKRAYIWDLGPEASAVRRLIEAGLDVFLLEWRDAPEAPIGRFATRTIDWAVEAVTQESGRRVALAGHSHSLSRHWRSAASVTTAPALAPPSRCIHISPGAD